MEEMGGTMTEDRIGMMMMMVVHTNILQEERNHLSGYCFSSLIWNFTNLTSNVRKGVLEIFWREFNEVDEHQLFFGRQRYTVNGVLAFLNIFTSVFLKMQISGGFLLYCFLFSLLLFSPIFRQKYVLLYFSSGEVDYRTQIRVPHGGFIICQS